MPPKNKEAERLEKILGAFMEGGVSPEEMMQAVDVLMSIIKQSEKLLLAKISENGDNKSVEIRQLESKLNSVSSQLANLVQKVKDDASLDASEIKQLIAREIKRLEQSIPEIPESEMYDDSELRTSLTEHKTLLDSLSILVVGENVRNALESLPEGEKLVIEAIEGLREELDKRQDGVTRATALIVHRLDQISDVSIAGVTNGQVLTYNSTTKTWGAGSGGGGYTNLTSFVDQTAHRVFYSNASGDVTELALGADGTFWKSNGPTSAPSFAVPSGSGDVAKVGTPVNNQVGVWTGDGTLEGDTALTFDTTTNTLATEIVTVTDDAYAAGWNGSTAVPTKNAIYDKIEALAGGGITRTIANISIPTTAGSVAVTDYVFFITNTTLTLPTAVSNTNRYTVKCISGTCVVDGAGVETIDGTADITIAVEDSVDLISNNTEFKVV